MQIFDYPYYFLNLEPLMGKLKDPKAYMGYTLWRFRNKAQIWVVCSDRLDIVKTLSLGWEESSVSKVTDAYT